MGEITQELERALQLVAQRVSGCRLASSSIWLAGLPRRNSGRAPVELGSSGSGATHPFERSPELYAIYVTTLSTGGAFIRKACFLCELRHVTGGNWRVRPDVPSLPGDTRGLRIPSSQRSVRSVTGVRGTGWPQQGTECPRLCIRAQALTASLLQEAGLDGNADAPALG